MLKQPEVLKLFPLPFHHGLLSLLLATLLNYPSKCLFFFFINLNRTEELKHPQSICIYHYVVFYYKMTFCASVSHVRGAAPQKTKILVCMTAYNSLYTCKHMAAGKAIPISCNIPQVFWLAPALGSGNTLRSSWYFLVVPEISRTFPKLGLVRSCSQKIVFVKSETG